MIYILFNNFVNISRRVLKLVSIDAEYWADFEKVIKLKEIFLLRVRKFDLLIFWVFQFLTHLLMEFFNLVKIFRFLSLSRTCLKKSAFKLDLYNACNFNFIYSISDDKYLFLFHSTRQWHYCCVPLYNDVHYYYYY